MKKINVTHQEEYTDGKKTRDDIVIQRTYHRATVDGLEEITQGDKISLSVDEVSGLIEKLQAYNLSNLK